MIKLRFSRQFKKDFKRYKHNKSVIDKLLDVFRMLEKGEKLPPIYQPHMLRQNLRGCMECHIESDILLIWIEDEEICILRIGSHAELFE